MLSQFQRTLLVALALFVTGITLMQPKGALAQSAVPASSASSPASSLLQLLQSYVAGETTKQKFLEDFGFKPDTDLFDTLNKVTQNGWVILGIGMQISRDIATRKVTESTENVDVGLPKKHVAKLVFNNDKLTRIEFK